MSKMKWVMKQYWRIGTIRALASLALGMLVLGRYYYIHIPILQDLAWIGAITLGVILIFVFLGIGWYYDSRARMWSQKVQVAIERDPYSYLPNLKNLALEFPVFYSVLETMKKVLQKGGHQSGALKDLIGYMDSWFQSAPVKSDITSAEKRTSEFMKNHFFSADYEPSQQRIPIRSRIKLGFETQLLRMTWIQSLTGLVQDVLIFGALYVLVLFPDSPDEIRLFLAIFGISMPLLIALAILGWFYDRRLRVWSVDTAVKIERNPYSYVAEPYIYSRIFPFFYAILKTFRDMFVSKGIKHDQLSESIDYLAKYFNLSVTETQDLQAARELRKSLGVLFTKNDKGSVP
jgi:hypothetical protein